MYLIPSNNPSLSKPIPEDEDLKDQSLAWPPKRHPRATPSRPPKVCFYHLPPQSTKDIPNWQSSQHHSHRPAPPQARRTLEWPTKPQPTVPQEGKRSDLKGRSKIFDTTTIKGWMKTSPVQIESLWLWGENIHTHTLKLETEDGMWMEIRSCLLKKLGKNREIIYTSTSMTSVNDSKSRLPWKNGCRFFHPTSKNSGLFQVL